MSDDTGACPDTHQGLLDPDDYDDGTVIPDVEVVGIRGVDNGRSCCEHVCCGKKLKVGDVLRLKKTIVSVNNRDVQAICMLKIVDACDGCTVGFLPKQIINKAYIKSKIGRMVMVTELYRKSDNDKKKEIDRRNRGVAGCVFLDDIPISE